MEVIGIVQTDLNEFSILFEPDKKKKQDQQGKQNGDEQNYQDQDHHRDDDSNFLSFLGGDILQETGKSRDKSQQQQEPQEMVVRIKGIPEGQKATFLQMYQIVTDAQKQADLEQQLTIVSIENPNGQQSQQGNQQQDKSKKASSKDQKNNQKDKNKQQYQ
ncbi:hypothetical protein [Brevibacillus laterosporus]|uniref:hypothetical protein n=1 Tax=Brevibacillus laterosporus TaxID=1465 RepID=UPI00264E609D|nr:hypothetical protein [Brevibacillus laterosporus]MDN9010409.1 hypothetical protein [Brevibacillus laterosporus]MDO0941296.1 hypothetical protein [Brevibacillus laterosporus]